MFFQPRWAAGFLRLLPLALHRVHRHMHRQRRNSRSGCCGSTPSLPASGYQQYRPALWTTPFLSSAPQATRVQTTRQPVSRAPRALDLAPPAFSAPQAHIAPSSARQRLIARQAASHLLFARLEPMWGAKVRGGCQTACRALQVTGQQQASRSLARWATSRSMSWRLADWRANDALKIQPRSRMGPAQVRIASVSWDYLA